MPVNPQTVPLQQLVELFGGILLVGMALTVPLFKFNLKRFIGSRLFLKIVFWIPIFLIFLGLLYLNSEAELVVFITLLLMAFREFLASPKRDKLSILYFILFSAAFLHFYLINRVYNADFVSIFITLSFGAVLADVTAFFAGNYLGFHKLPAVINKKKSWEGVLGQIVGALAGVALVNTFVTPVVFIYLFLPIGLGSAFGDLANSYIKRRLNIKDWSRAIPGHGGYIDRLSSLAGAGAFAFYFLKLAGI